MFFSLLSKGKSSWFCLFKYLWFNILCLYFEAVNTKYIYESMYSRITGHIPGIWYHISSYAISMAYFMM